MIEITNFVCTADLGCRIDLRRLTLSCVDIEYRPQRFSGAVWKQFNIGGSCLVFSNGKIVVNGKATSRKQARR